MKKINTSALFISLLFVVPFLGCNKYPDGPALSLRSRTARLANTWKVENYKIGGNDHTSFYEGYTETFTADGNYTYSFGKISGTGRWNFQNQDAEVNLTGISNLDSRVMVILKLENNSLWYYYLDGDNYKEVHLVPAR